MSGKIILKKLKSRHKDWLFHYNLKEQFIVKAVNMFLKCNFVYHDVFINVHISMFKKPGANFYLLL